MYVDHIGYLTGDGPYTEISIMIFGKFWGPVSVQINIIFTMHSFINCTTQEPEKL